MNKSFLQNITVIIPLHKYDMEVEKYLKEKSLKSLKNIGSKSLNVLAIGPEKTMESFKALYESLKVPCKLETINNESTGVQAQINKAAFACTTKYFTILEFDDAFAVNWFDSCEPYVQDTPDVAAFLSIFEQCDTEGKFVSFMNEMAWAKGYADELGYLTEDGLKVYPDFNISGALINTEKFISSKGIKPSLKIASWYEFLLRFCHQGNKVFVVPRIGYVHTVNRDGSYMKETSGTLKDGEGTWLLETARQEYFFDEDRNKTFES